MPLKKRSFADIKSKFSKKAKFKPDRFFDLGPAFLDATGIPGPAMGHLQMFLGHSDTGKTTALVKAAVDAQKKFAQNFSNLWSHVSQNNMTNLF